MDNYTLWTKHGEPVVVMQDDEEDGDHNIADWAHLYEARAFEDEPMDDAEEMDETVEDDDQPPDELGQVLVDSQRDYETLKEQRCLRRCWRITKNYCIQIASRGLKSWVPHLKCCSGRQLMVSPIRDLRSY